MNACFPCAYLKGCQYPGCAMVYHDGGAPAQEEVAQGGTNAAREDDQAPALAVAQEALQRKIHTKDSEPESAH